MATHAATGCWWSTTTGRFVSRLARALELDGYAGSTWPPTEPPLSPPFVSARPDVAIVDVMMPNIDGLTVCRVLRAEKDRLPILMLTARTETLRPGRRARRRCRRLPAQAVRARRAAGPAARAAAPQPARRRRRRPAEPCCRSPTCASIPTSRRVWRGDDEIELSKTEFDLLELLVRNAASCSTTRSSTSASGTTTSGPTRRTSRSTSATCAARSTPATCPSSSTRCAASATRARVTVSLRAQARDRHGRARRRIGGGRRRGQLRRRTEQPAARARSTGRSTTPPTH